MPATIQNDLPRRMLNVKQAADALGLSVRTMWRLIGTKELGVVRFGRAVRIPVEAVETLIQKKGGAA